MPLIKMERHTLQQRTEIVKIRYKNGENFAETVRKIESFLRRRETPSRSVIMKLMQKFELFEQASDVKNRIPVRRARTIEILQIESTSHRPLCKWQRQSGNSVRAKERETMEGFFCLCLRVPRERETA